jgi:hypothetical protein
MAHLILRHHADIFGYSSKDIVVSDILVKSTEGVENSSQGGDLQVLTAKMVRL